jgi:predicted heme/steroid binding protein
LNKYQKSFKNSKIYKYNFKCGIGEVMRTKLIVLIVLFCAFLAIGCAGKESGAPEQAVTPVEVATQPEEKATEKQNETEMQNETERQNAIERQNVTEYSKLKEFTLEELSAYDGKNETIYVAYQGKVYDVSSDNYLWKDGNHEGCIAGKDITDEMDQTPHGSKLLKKYPVVVTLKK